MEKIRDRSIDLSRGLAILFVFLGHGILYHPIHMDEMYPWCATLEHFIVSFNMPMFFLISGYLFAKSRKSSLEQYKGKWKRIAIPYVTTMSIIVGVKLFTPTSWSYNPAVLGGGKSLIINALFYGGDRWFVYTLFIIFLIIIPLKHWLRNIWMAIGLAAITFVVYYLDVMPSIFKLDDVFHYISFFLVGMCCSNYYSYIKKWCLRCWIPIYVVFIILNILLIDTLCHSFLLYRLVLPIVGTIAFMTMAFQMEKIINNSHVARYIEYAGKYSLQFYLFEFCYPIIRIVIVSVLNITNSFVIVISVFFLQLLSATIFVEITRRIKWLKIPCGY